MASVSLTINTMSASFCCTFVEVAAARGKRILLSASVGFLAGLAAVVRICLFTMFLVCTDVFDAPVAATVTIL